MDRQTAKYRRTSSGLRTRYFLRKDFGQFRRGEIYTLYQVAEGVIQPDVPDLALGPAHKRPAISDWQGLHERLSGFPAKSVDCAWSQDRAGRRYGVPQSLGGTCAETFSGGASRRRPDSKPGRLQTCSGHAAHSRDEAGGDFDLEPFDVRGYFELYRTAT